MLTNYTSFYYHALTPKKQAIYKILYQGLKARQTAIEVRVDPQTLSGDDIYDIITMVYNDTPSFYYLKVTQMAWAVLPDGYRILPNYLYTKEQIEGFDAQLEEGLKKFRERFIRPDMTDYEKEQVIHDYLVRTVTYDRDAPGDVDGIGEAFNVLGALLKKRAVCWGIACAFKLLCDYCKIKCFVVIGDTIPKQGDAGHAWNMVKLENESYHVDVTWDIKEKGDISFCYDYFNLNDKIIRLDHTWESELYPPCEAVTENYYYKNRLFVKTTSELTEYIAKRLQAGHRYIVVKLVGRMPPPGVTAKAIEEGFAQARKYVGYKYVISERTHNICIELAE